MKKRNGLRRPTEPMTTVIRTSADRKRDYMLPMARAFVLYREGKLAFNRDAAAFCHKQEDPNAKELT